MAFCSNEQLSYDFTFMIISLSRQTGRLKRFGSKDVGNKTNKTNLARRESQNIVIYLYLQRKARFAILQELLRRNIFSGVGPLPRKGKTSDYVKRPSNRHLV